MDLCSFGIKLNEKCHLLTYSRLKGLRKFLDLQQDLQEIYLYRSGLHNFNDNETICYHHEQLFGSVFERKNDKCCDVFKKHNKKVKG